MGLSDGLKSFQIGLAVLIQYRSVTDTHPASIHPARHVAVAITLNAKASSLKSSGTFFRRLAAQSLDFLDTALFTHMQQLTSRKVFYAPNGKIMSTQILSSKLYSFHILILE